MRQRLARALPVIVVAGALLLAGPVASFAATSSTYTTTVTVGASRTLPSGGFGASDGCEVGIGGTLEFPQPPRQPLQGCVRLQGGFGALRQM